MPQAHADILEELSKIGTSFESSIGLSPHALKMTKPLSAHSEFHENYFGHMVRKKSTKIELPKELKSPKGMNCERCAGPLPSAHGVSVKCEYCGVINLLTNQPQPAHKPVHPAPPKPGIKISGFWQVVLMIIFTVCGIWVGYKYYKKYKVDKYPPDLLVK